MFNLFDFSSNADYEYLISVMGQDVLINDQPRKVLITNRKINQNYNDKNISALSPLNRGDIVLYEGKKYMIISEESKRSSGRWKGIMRHLPFVLKVNHNCNYIDVPCWIDSPSFGIVDGKILSTSTGEIFVHTQDNDQTRQIAVDDRFLKYAQAFKIAGIDRFSQPGIITFICEKDSIDPTKDDVQNDLAGWFTCQQQSEPDEPEQSEQNLHIVIKSTSSTPNEIRLNQSKTYFVEVYSGDNLIEGETVSWELFADDKVSSTNLAIITSQDGSSCTVKNNNATTGYIQLRAVLNSDNTVEAWLRIQMKALF